MIDVGLIGFGFAGRVFHAPILSAVPGLRLRAILQRTPQHDGNDAADIYPEAQIVQTVEELLRIDTIRLVVVATPNTSHYPLAKQCLLAGRDVVVDKPFTTTYAEAAELVELARKHNRLLAVYQNLRSNGDFRTIRQLTQAGRFGRIASYEAHFDRFRLQMRPGAWRERQEPGSGVFFDLGVHLIDQAFVLFGLPEAITADIRMERKESIVDDSFDVTLHYSKMRALLRASMIALAPDVRYVVRGEEGAYVKYGTDPQEEALKRGEIPKDDSWGREPKEKWGVLSTPGVFSISAETIPTLPGDYRLYYSNVRDAMLGKSPIDVTGEQMLNVMAALELSVASSRERRTLDWKNIGGQRNSK